MDIASLEGFLKQFEEDRLVLGQFVKKGKEAEVFYYFKTEEDQMVELPYEFTLCSKRKKLFIRFNWINGMPPLGVVTNARIKASELAHSMLERLQKEPSYRLFLLTEGYQVVLQGEILGRIGMHTIDEYREKTEAIKEELKKLNEEFIKKSKKERVKVKIVGAGRSKVSTILSDSKLAESKDYYNFFVFDIPEKANSKLIKVLKTNFKEIEIINWRE